MHVNNFSPSTLKYSWSFKERWVTLTFWNKFMLQWMNNFALRFRAYSKGISCVEGAMAPFLNLQEGVKYVDIRDHECAFGNTSCSKFHMPFSWRGIKAFEAIFAPSIQQNMRKSGKVNQGLNSNTTCCWISVIIIPSPFMDINPIPQHIIKLIRVNIYHNIWSPQCWHRVAHHVKNKVAPLLLKDPWEA